MRTVIEGGKILYFYGLLPKVVEISSTLIIFSQHQCVRKINIP